MMAWRYNCPFCSVAYTTEYEVQYHIEELHTEDSPFVPSARGNTPSYGRQVYTSNTAPQQATTDLVEDHGPNASASTRSTRLRCTRHGCGQTVALDAIDQHLAMHDRQDKVRSDRKQDSRASERGPKQSMTSSPKQSTSRAKQTTSDMLLDFLSGTGAKSRPAKLRRDTIRLGKRELGQHAFETAMPRNVRSKLEDAARPVLENRIDRSGRLVKTMRYVNETCGLVLSLANVLAAEGSYEFTLCDCSVKHIYRIPCDGNFCGYWNIQMLLTYVLARESPERGLPTVLQIQQTIEQAWSQGICSYGRQETGGILNTRKWIGTHEALAFFTKIGVSVMAGSFQASSTTGRSASNALLDFVEDYFGQAASREEDVCCTDLSPIYLQRAGHSVTIIGIVHNKDSNERGLLVFDPSFEVDIKISAAKRNLSPKTAAALLLPYIRTEDKLAKWDEFEILAITDTAGLLFPE